MDFSKEQRAEWLEIKQLEKEAMDRMNKLREQASENSDVKTVYRVCRGFVAFEPL